MATIYGLKPMFQALLRPVAKALAEADLTANAVTVAALLLSIAQGAWIAFDPTAALPLLILPLTLFIRMALNTIDGLMAKEHDLASPEGAVLNELCDVMADAVLYLPFAFVPGVSPVLVVLVVVGGIIAEMTGALGPLIGAPRRYNGPLGKSDRAFAFGLLALLIGLGFTAGLWTSIYLAVLLLLTVRTIFNRAHRIVAESDLS